MKVLRSKCNIRLVITILSVTIALIAPSISFGFEFSFIVDNPRWSISKLNGRTSFADGANCFNAALVAKGYSDYLIYSDPIELQYFLINFCTKVTNKTQKGDIMVTQQYFIKHAGIYMGGDFVFEKKNNEGHNKRRSGFSDTGAYSIKSISESPFFNNCTGSKCSLDSYSCQNNKFVRSAISPCETLHKKIGLVTIQNKLQRFTMNKKITLSNSEDILNDITFLEEELTSVSGGEECHLYTLVKGASVVGHLQLLNFEEDHKWIFKINTLKSKLNTLRLKIIDKKIFNIKYKQLLEESLWLGRPVRI